MRRGKSAGRIRKKFVFAASARVLIIYGSPATFAMNVLLSVFISFFALHGFTTPAQESSNRSSAQTTTQPFTSSEACAPCHAEITQNYLKTAMARASGPAMEGFLPGDFVHSPSGVHYRVYQENGRAKMSFERPGDPGLTGKRELLYFIGSGHRGRTYLFAVDNFVFEAPMNWYGQQQIWDMAPAYQKAKEIPMNLPAVSSCLACHTSNSQLPVAGTENKYDQPLFAHGGITCERCHGPAATHVAQPTAKNIVNPAKLSPDRRDAVCMQCHFEGKVAIQRPGHSLAQFQPGDNLSDYIRYYLVSGSSSDQLGALSQTEALAQSVCKRKSGARMACTSCHDPHYTPSAQEKSVYYRAKCVACHGAKFPAKHHSRTPDCTSCHMPATSTSDIAHTEATDHRILRNQQKQNPSASNNSGNDPPRLIPFPPEAGEGSTRDVALAWASLVESGMTSAEGDAERWLRKAAGQSPNDPDVQSALGFAEQKKGHTEIARQHYQRALELDPRANEAALNLGVMEAQAGHVDRAITLLQGPFARIPGRSEVGINLSILYCATGELQKARDTLNRVLQFNPDVSTAKKLQRQLNSSPPTCEIAGSPSGNIQRQVGIQTPLRYGSR